MITTTLPNMTAGKPYQECIALTGTKPFTLVSHNLPSGKAVIVGDNLCISIDNPDKNLDFVAEVRSGCANCDSETIKVELKLPASSASCPCVPASLAPGQTIPALVTGQYFASIQLLGTEPFEIDGSVPRCLKAEIKGNIVQVSGRYDGVGNVSLGVKNACSCDRLMITIPKA